MKFVSCEIIKIICAAIGVEEALGQGDEDKDAEVDGGGPSASTGEPPPACSPACREEKTRRSK